jgi:hypothetical protein
MHPVNAEEYHSVRDFFDTTLLCFLFIPASCQKICFRVDAKMLARIRSEVSVAPECKSTQGESAANSRNGFNGIRRF